MPALDCQDVVAIDVNFSMVSDDGAFNEEMALTVEAAFLFEVYLYRQLEDLSGSFDVEDWADAEYDATRAFLDLSFSPEGVSGEIRGDGENESEGDGPDAVISLTSFEVATLTSAAAEA